MDGTRHPAGETGRHIRRRLSRSGLPTKPARRFWATRGGRWPASSIATQALGLTPVAATELEFYLVDPQSQRPVGPVSPVTGRRLDSDAALSIDEIDDFEAFIHDVYDACRTQGIPVDTAIAENGVGQFEINLNHVADALRAADDAVLFKRTVKGIARKHGFAACFMAKPYGDRAGNGFHVHFSLTDAEGRNVFDDGTDQGSEIMRHAVGGLLAAMAESTLVFAPHFNSYRRLRPSSYAPTAVAWGYENRMVAIRIPGGPTSARRIEHRVSGADANPYLVLAAILGAALIGIERQMSPGDPAGNDGQGLPPAKLPPDWASAIASFESGTACGGDLPGDPARLLHRLQTPGAEHVRAQCQRLRDRDLSRKRLAPTDRQLPAL